MDKGSKKTDPGLPKGFLKDLVEKYVRLRKLRPNEMCIFNVIAKYGSYQITVGPEYKAEEINKLKLEPHSRPVEVNGSMHHLFVDPTQISPIPNQDELRRNLKGSIIMRDVVIHIYDNDGRGFNIKIEKGSHDGVHAKKKINLAGQKGSELLRKYNSSGRLIKETYRIIQEDIIRTLKKFG